MNTARLIPKIAALATSMTLAGGFVYVKAGGVLPGLPFNRDAQAADAPPIVLSGSKSYSGTTTILPGSKSAGVNFSPPPVSSSSPTAPLVTKPTPEQMKFMAGSKSIIISEPVKATPTVTQPANPSADVLKPTMLPGSKSTVIIPSPSSSPWAPASPPAVSPSFPPKAPKPLLTPPSSSPISKKIKAFPSQTLEGNLAPPPIPSSPEFAPQQKQQQQQIQPKTPTMQVLSGSKSMPLINPFSVPPTTPPAQQSKP